MHLTNEPLPAFTPVPDRFITDYMNRMDNTSIRLYLTFLHYGSTGCDLSADSLSRTLRISRQELATSIRTLESLHLVDISRDTDGRIRSIQAKMTLPSPEADKQEPQSLAGSEEDELSSLVFTAERCLGRSLSRNDLDAIFYWYDTLHFPADTIEYLIKDSTSHGHSSMRYIQKIAEALAARNITSAEEAQSALEANRSVYRTVMKSFGINGRQLTSAETRYLSRWSHEWKFSDEMIAEACQRTIQATHEPAFHYADSILSSWQKQNIRTLEDVRQADARHLKKRSDTVPSRPQATGFSNFRQRDNDYDDLQRKLLRDSLSEK